MEMVLARQQALDQARLTHQRDEDTKPETVVETAKLYFAFLSEKD